VTKAAEAEVRSTRRGGGQVTAMRPVRWAAAPPRHLEALQRVTRSRNCSGLAASADLIALRPLCYTETTLSSDHPGAISSSLSVGFTRARDTSNGPIL